MIIIDVLSTVRIKTLGAPANPKELGVTVAI